MSSFEALPSPLTNQWRVWKALFIREAEQGGFFELVGRLVEPAIMMLATCALAYFINRHPPFGDSILLFSATGVAPIYLFGLEVKYAVKSNDPRTPFVNDLDIFLVKGLMSFVHLTIASILLLIFLYETQTKEAYPVRPDAAVLIWFLVAALGFGIGLITRFIGLVFPLFENVFPALFRALVHISGVYFVMDNVPPTLRYYLSFNPMTHAVSWLRLAFYGSYPHFTMSISYFLAFTFFALVIGILLQVLLGNRMA